MLNYYCGVLEDIIVGIAAYLGLHNCLQVIVMQLCSLSSLGTSSRVELLLPLVSLTMSRYLFSLGRSLVRDKGVTFKDLIVNYMKLVLAINSIQ